MGRIVWYGQWVAAFAIPLMIAIGRVALGAGLGWFMLLALLFSPVAILLLLAPPLITRADAQVRTTRTCRPAYSRATLALWAVGVLAVLTATDQGDGPPVDSVLSRWTPVSISTSQSLFAVLLLVFWVSWVVVLVLALRERRTGADP